MEMYVQKTWLGILQNRLKFNHFLKMEVIPFFIEVPIDFIISLASFNLGPPPFTRLLFLTDVLGLRFLGLRFFLTDFLLDIII